MRASVTLSSANGLLLVVLGPPGGGKTVSVPPDEAVEDGDSVGCSAGWWVDDAEEEGWAGTGGGGIEDEDGGLDISALVYLCIGRILVNFMIMCRPMDILKGDICTIGGFAIVETCFRFAFALLGGHEMVWTWDGG